MHQPIAIGTASGTSAGLALALLREFISSPALESVCPLPPLLPDRESSSSWVHYPSLILGLSIGLLAGPLLDIAWLLRQRWRRFHLGPSCGESRIQAFAQGPCMSAGSDLQILQIELAELRNRVARLELRVQELEGTSAASVPGTPAASRAAVRSSTPGSSSVTSQVGAPQEVEQSWSFREEVSREIGNFIRRALAGDHRGESGRKQDHTGFQTLLDLPR